MEPPPQVFIDISPKASYLSLSKEVVDGHTYTNRAFLRHNKNMMTSEEYDTAIAFMRQFHSRQVVTRPSSSTSAAAPRSGGILSSIDESQSHILDSSSNCLQTNRIVRVQTIRCLVGLEDSGEH